MNLSFSMSATTSVHLWSAHGAAAALIARFMLINEFLPTADTSR
jgi:hypothetical protein